MEPQKKPCWNCGQPVGAEDVICDNCGLGLLIEDDVPEDTTLDELDALIEDSTDISLGSLDAELDSLLEKEDELDIEELLTDSSDDSAQSEVEVQNIPQSDDSSQDFTVIEKSLPNMLEKMAQVKEEMEEDPEVFVAHPETPSFSIPEMPTFAEFETEEETKLEEDLRTIETRPLTRKRILFSILGQYLYWFFVFFLLGVLTVDVTDPNVLIPEIQARYREGFEVVRLSEHLYFGVGVYFPIGWFFRYKLKQWGSSPTLLKGLLFLVGQFIAHSLITYGLLLINPGVIISLYLISGWFVQLVSFFIGGLIAFIMGYWFLFDMIYEATPASDLEELQSIS